MYFNIETYQLFQEVIRPRLIGAECLLLQASQANSPASATQEPLEHSYEAPLSSSEQKSSVAEDDPQVSVYGAHDEVKT